jgi:hypothetical protein
VVDPVDLADALDRRNRRPRAGREQDPVRSQLLFADTHRVRLDELRLALVRVEVRRLEILDPLRLGLLDRVLARLDPLHVDERGADVDPELAGELVDVVHQLRDHEIRLRRLARDVRAAAAPTRALDERDLGPTDLRRLRRGVTGGRSGAEHDEVVALHRPQSVVKAEEQTVRPRRVRHLAVGAGCQPAPASTAAALGCRLRSGGLARLYHVARCASVPCSPSPS